jgi:hypothetical protein
MCKIHIGEEIRQQLKEQERSIRWLAQKVGCDQSNLNKKLQCSSIDTGLLSEISKVLEVDFFMKLSNGLTNQG